jgi:hypothetical protein
VPYAWGVRDSLEQFNDFMNGGNNGKFAGDIDDPNSGCGRGIDCSGLVSQAWGLSGPYGTCSLEDVSGPLLNYYALQPGDIMNRCSPIPRHTIIFDSFDIGGMWGYEATIYGNYDRVVRIFRQFSSIADYVPRKYNHVCNKIHLSVIIKSETEMNSPSLSSNSYPPPETHLPSNSYQPLNPYP